jgi:hypothetical protein
MVFFRHVIRLKLYALFTSLLWCMPRLCHPPWFAHPNVCANDEAPGLCNSLHSFCVWFPYILFSTLFLIIFSLCPPWDYYVLGLCPSSGILTNTKGRKVSDLFPSSGEGVGDTCYIRSEGTNSSHWDFNLLFLMDPTESVSPTPSLEAGNRSSFQDVVIFRIPDDGQSLNPN